MIAPRVQRRTGCSRRRGRLVGIWLLGVGLGLAAPAGAQYSAFYTDTGHLTVSVDAAGSNASSHTVEVSKPSAAATVRAAFLLAAARIDILTGEVTLNGMAIGWDQTVSGSPPGTSFLFFNHLRDVTDVVSAALDGGPAGTYLFTLTESAARTVEIDGEVLVVVFDDPSRSATRTLTLFFGIQAGFPTVTTFGASLPSGFDPARPGAQADLGLGISFSSQGTDQVTRVTVNGARISSSAGGQDDGQSGNGALITVGGLGDALSLPADPNSPPAGNPIFRYDDELYSLLGLLSPLDTGVTVGVTNPTNDDDVFFAYTLLSPGPEADLSITKSDGVTAVAPGGTVTYTITVTNDGPDVSGGATVTDTFPPGLSGCTWTCAAPAGGSCTAGPVAGNIADPVSLPPGQQAIYTAHCTVGLGAAGTTLSNTATVAPASGVHDPDGAANTATDADTQVDPGGDLQVTLTDPGAVVAGTDVEFTMEVSNAGSLTADGATAGLAFSPAVTAVSWFCLAGPGASCTSLGSGPISDTADLPPGGFVRYFATATVDPAATGTLVAAATVTPPAGFVEFVPANNSADVFSTLSREADLGITKSDGVTTALPGGSLTYTVTVTNSSGPSDVSGAMVEDLFPPELSCSWSCTPAAGAICTPGPATGDLIDSAELPRGASATYTADCAIATTAAGTLLNTATVALPAAEGVDPNPANDLATDGDTQLVLEADLALAKTAAPDPVFAGAVLTYRLTVTNQGPTASSGSTLTDTLPAGVSVVSGALPPGVIFADGFESGDLSAWGPPPAGPRCHVAGGQVVCDVGPLAPGESAEVVLEVEVAAGLSGTLVNSASVSGDDTDPEITNDSVQISTAIATAQADLGVILADDPDPVSVGQTLTYTATVTNAGPAAATGVRLDDPLPPALGGASARVEPPEQGSCTAGGSVSCDLGTMAIGAQAAVIIEATVGASAPPALSNEVVVSAAEPDLNPGNDRDFESTAVLGAAVSPGPAPAGLEARIAVSGEPVEGGRLRYSVILANAGPGAGADGTGYEFLDVLPAELALIRATASHGRVDAEPRTGAVTWSGGLPPGSEVTLWVEASLRRGTAGRVIVNRGHLLWDTDGDGEADRAVVTTGDVAVEVRAEP